MSVTRRKFINDSSRIIAATGLSTLAPASMFASVRKNNLSPNEKITVGLIGAKNMGFGDLENALKQPNVECVGVCDIDDAILNQRTAEVQKLQGKAPVQYKDFRKLIDNK